MRTVALTIIPLLLAGCGAKYKPGDPVITGYERAYKFPVHRPHEGLVYMGLQPTTTTPVVPLLAFGAAFDLDFVVMPREGDFEMLEYARIGLPTGPQWVVLETSAQSGDQTLIANLDGIEAFMPEIPLARQSGNLQVTDKSTEFTVDVALEYTNSRGQKVEAKFAGDPPTKQAKHRNGQTFNHSANQLLAVLDIPSSESLFDADVRVDGSGLGFKKIAGFVPAQFVLEQAQGGLATANFKIVPGDSAVGGPEYTNVVVNAPGAPPVAAVSPENKLKEGVALNSATVRKCWTDRASAAPTLAGGEIAFAFQVEAGKVTEASAVPGETDAFTDAELVSCVTEAIKGWSLPEEVSGKATWPFTFVPGSEEDGTNPSLSLGTGSLEAAAAPEPAPAEGTNGTNGTNGHGTNGDDLPDDGSEGSEEAAPPQDLELSNFTTIHKLANGKTVELQWLVTQQGDRVVATQTTDLRTLRYNYRLVQDAYLELVSIAVEQYGRATPVAAITFNPPLPDMRWSFNGRRPSQFVIDVNGQQGHATGEIESYWSESGPMLKVSPSAPDWTKSRPLLTSIQFRADGSTDVLIERKE